MASFSTSYHESTSSDSDNEIRNYSAFETLRTNWKNSSKTRLASNLSRQTLNNSLRYFKKFKKQKNLHRASGVLVENKNTTLPYSLNSITDSKNIQTYERKKFKNTKKKQNPYLNSYSINLNNKFIAAVESSSSSDFSHLKLISTDNGINTSDTKESTGNKSDFDKKKTTINKSNYRRLSLSSSDISQTNIDSENFKNICGDELNLQELLSDCSLSFNKNEHSDEDSQLRSTLLTDKSLIQMESNFPKPLSMNSNFGNDDNFLPQEPSNIFINLPELSNNNIEDEHYQFVDTMETDEHEHVLNSEHCELNKTKSLSDFDDLNEPVSNSVKSVEGSIASEPVCKHCNGFNKLKIDTKNSGHNTSERIDNTNEKKSESKSLLNITTAKKREILRIKKPHVSNKLQNRSFKNTSIVDDIGLEYDTSEDMIELPNGAVVPAFLSTLKPKYVKKLCACGITKSEIPPFWSESFHDILHKNIYKLWFKDNVPENDIINCKHNDLFYRIVVLRVDHYNGENVNKSIKDVEDFICLEYGIFKKDTQSNDYLKYLAVLPNLKVIGYLEVRPIQKAYRYTNDKQPLEEIVSVKFGVSKIWVLIKYRDKFVDINLLDTFCKREKLQKEDLAFHLGGCREVRFIQEYMGNENILIYNEFST